VSQVAPAVPRLLGGCAVIAQPVGLDHESQLGPVEVDAESGHPRAGLGRRQVRAPNDREEAALELGVGEDEGTLTEERPERCDSWSRCGPRERAPKLLPVNEIELVCLVDGRFELPWSGRRGENRSETWISPGFVISIPHRAAAL
jgi:hypothetical protein